MPNLFSYVVDHDHGFAPNPFGGFCSLAKCKYGGSRRNIVEMARVGDWIAGTGGSSRKSAGHGRLVYAMRVDEIKPLDEYCAAHHRKRVDAKPEPDGTSRVALLSYHFFYFGKNAIDVSRIPTANLHHPFEKAGPGYRCDFTDEFINDFARWLETSFRVGVHGRPCAALGG